MERSRQVFEAIMQIRSNITHKVVIHFPIGWPLPRCPRTGDFQDEFLTICCDLKRSRLELIESELDEASYHKLGNFVAPITISCLLFADLFAQRENLVFAQ